MRAWSQQEGWVDLLQVFVYKDLQVFSKKVLLVEGKSSCSQNLEISYQLFLVCLNLINICKVKTLLQRHKNLGLYQRSGVQRYISNVRQPP